MIDVFPRDPDPQAFMMLADVPADGYSVELGQLEKPDERGTILSTGQCVVVVR